MISAYSVFCQLARHELAQRSLLEARVVPRTLAAGEVLFSAGQANPCVYVVLQGVVTMTYETAGGDSWIKGFAEAGVCFASLTALAPGGVSSYTACAASASLVEVIPFAVLEELGESDPHWQRALSQAYRFYGQRKEKREMELLTLTPEQRYLRFLEDHPTLASQLRQRDIASFIRITPVALSRIRARLRKVSAQHENAASSAGYMPLKRC